MAQFSDLRRGRDVFRSGTRNSYDAHVNPRLLEFPRNMLLPHMGTPSRTQDTEKMEMCADLNLKDFLVTGNGKDLVPELQL